MGTKEDFLVEGGRGKAAVALEWRSRGRVSYALECAEEFLLRSPPRFKDPRLAPTPAESVVCDSPTVGDTERPITP